MKTFLKTLNFFFLFRKTKLRETISTPSDRSQSKPNSNPFQSLYTTNSYQKQKVSKTYSEKLPSTSFDRNN